MYFVRPFVKSALQARNALKRIAKMPYTMEMAEEFEQAYLHLAHLYVDRGKFDLAQVRTIVKVVSCRASIFATRPHHVIIGTTRKRARSTRTFLCGEPCFFFHVYNSSLVGVVRIKI